MDHIDRRRDGAQVVRDRNRQPRELARSDAELRAVYDGGVAAPKQPQREVALVSLHTAHLAEGVSGDQNTHACFLTSSNSASRKGIMCSARRMTCW